MSAQTPAISPGGGGTVGGVAYPPVDDARWFQALRPRLFGIAYRILGNAADADDVVQDTWLRWQRADRSGVRDASAFLATTAKRLAINVTQSAHARRDTYVASGVAEPVDTEADPALGAERREALGLVVLVLLERLSATERAAYLLREAFDYPYRRIAQVLSLSEANARQVVTRARLHLVSGRRRPVSPTEQQRLLEAVVAAAQTGDLARLERSLTAGLPGAAADPARPAAVRAEGVARGTVDLVA